MHKGYAFVQYNNHEEAKRATMSEDGKIYAGQTLGTQTLCTRSMEAYINFCVSPTHFKVKVTERPSMIAFFS